MNFSDLQAFLDDKSKQYGDPSLFIPTDPIQIPHSFSKSEDIEIAGFLTALIAWGQRKTIIKNGFLWMELMDHSPYDFLCNAKATDFQRFDKIIHRTLNGTDAVFISQQLATLIREHKSINNYLKLHTGGAKEKIQALHHYFVHPNTPERTKKHIANPAKNSSAKRLNMYLRWMVRPKNAIGVDFGIWDCLQPADLLLPLDVHTGNISRKLGILQRKQNDWKAVEEVSNALKKMCPADPIKYDYALFGLGAFEGF